MARITKTQLTKRFEQAAKMLGWHTDNGWVKQDNGTMKAVIGYTYLDHSQYGGYAIEQHMNDGGGVVTITGWGKRYKPAELMAYLDGMIMAAATLKKEG